MQYYQFDDHFIFPPKILLLHKPKIFVLSGFTIYSFNFRHTALYYSSHIT